MQPERYQFHYDEEVACFYLGNLSGQIVGYQQYRPFATKEKRNDPKLGRYYTYCHNQIGVWGLESFDYRDDLLFVTEGIFDACQLHRFGLPAIAALANNPKQLKPWLGLIHRKKIAICDGDSAGFSLRSICDDYKLTPPGKDLGDITGEEKNTLLREWLL